ncbi:MAG: hypothetical protein POELPBGB_01729 [Bacteroidia bacterium]|nr:hypothetical protein [Bacteroidia bacterium]
MIKKLYSGLAEVTYSLFLLSIIIILFSINREEIAINGVTNRLILIDIICALVWVLIVLSINRYLPYCWVDDDYIYFKTIFSRKDLVFRKTSIKKSGAVLSPFGGKYYVIIEHNSKKRLFLIVPSFFMSKEEVLNDLKPKI